LQTTYVITQVDSMWPAPCDGRILQN